MKIKTITCHDVYNYGASLQAYALQTYLESQGHDVEIIDYKPDYLLPKSFWYVPENSHYYSLAKKYKLIHLLLCLYFAYKRFPSRNRKRSFDNFTSNFLKLTRRYNSLEELQSNCPEADIYIAGSDQIWNPLMNNGKDSAFFLDFGSDGIRRISYAASIAINYLPDYSRDFLKSQLSKFDAIAVREQSSVELINNLGYHCVSVVDPVCLLSKNQWLDFAGNEVLYSKRYLLVYDIPQESRAIEITAKFLSDKYNLKIVSVSTGRKLKYADKNIFNAGPKEFVNLIANASIVISNSFHATVFSVILQRPFRVYYEESNISRMKDFLAQLGLDDRLNTPCNNDLFSYDWKNISIRFNSLISSSIDFLNTYTK